MSKEEQDKLMGELLIDMFNGIKQLINNEIDVYSNKFLSPNDISKHLLHIGFEDLDQFNSNGWDYDNWSYFMYNNEKYCISGHGYYGGISVNKDME